MSIPSHYINTPNIQNHNPMRRPAQEMILKKSEIPSYDMNRLLAAKEVVLDKPNNA